MSEQVVMLTDKVEGKPISLSPSSMNVIREAPHFLWMEKNYKQPWPRGIFPSLPGGMDRVLKPHYDGWRAKGELPPEVKSQGVVEGILYPDQARVNKWRARGANMLATVVTAVVDGVTYGVPFRGMVDDIVQVPDSRLSVFDFKTKGSEPKDGDTERYYGNQGDGYHLLFERNGFKATGKGYFAYYYPIAATGGGAATLGFTFGCEVKTIETNGARAEALVQEAIRILVGPMPSLTAGHEACEYLGARGKLLTTLREQAKAPAGRN